MDILKIRAAPIGTKLGNYVYGTWIKIPVMVEIGSTEDTVVLYGLWWIAVLTMREFHGALMMGKLERVM